MRSGRALVAATAVTLAAVLLIAPPASAEDVVVSVDVGADTYTASSAPSTNYGTSASLAAYSSPVITSILRFTIPATPSGHTLTGATLRLSTTTISSAGSTNAANIRTATDTWNETTTVYTNRPTVSGPTIGTLPGGTSPNTRYAITIDPTPLTEGSITLAIENTGTDSLWLWSRQSPTAPTRPVLDLTYTGGTPADTTPPSTPTGLTASATGDTVALTWQPSTDNTAVTGYTLHRSDTANFTPTTATTITTTTNTTHTDTNRPPGTWHYRVTAHDAAGNTSTPSTTATTTVTPPVDSTPPTAPTGLTASVTGTTVALGWQGSTDDVGVTGYTVHRSPTAGFTPDSATIIGTATTLAYSDASRPAGTWHYRVTASDAAGNTSTPSDPATATVAAEPPGEPTTVSVDVGADTYTASSAPSTNYGTSASLAAYSSPVITSILRFTIPATPSGHTLTGATLRLSTTTISSAGSTNAANIRTATDTWNETTTVYTNRPTVSGPTIGTLPGGTSPNTRYAITIDPTPLTEGSITLAIENTGTDSLWLWSRQSPTAPTRPVLDLTYTGGTPADTTPPSTPTGLTASATGDTVALTWQPSTDNTAVTGYTLHRSDTANFTPTTATTITTTTNTTHTDTNRPPGTWHYRVTAHDAAGNTSTPSTTATTTTSAQGDVTVMAVGDIACQSGTPVTTTTCRHGDVASLISAAGPDRVIALGDLQYQQATLPQFMAPGAYHDTFGPLKSITLPVLGNHEYLDGTNGYFDYFYGSGVSTGPLGARPSGYYSTQVGSWTFIGLNTECDAGGVSGGCGVGSPQYTWLQQQLATSGSCTIVAAHRPRWSTGASHGSYPQMAALWDLMATNEVDVVLSGHNHVSEIFKPIGVSGPGASPTLDPAGIRAFTAGGGGVNIQGLSATSDPLIAALEARSRVAFGPLKLVLGADGYSWDYLPVSGMTFTNSGTTGSFSGADDCT